MNMDREEIRNTLTRKVERLAAMHLTYRMENTEHFIRQKEEIAEFIRTNRICVKKELDPLTRHLYNRYFV